MLFDNERGAFQDLIVLGLSSEVWHHGTKLETVSLDGCEIVPLSVFVDGRGSLLLERSEVRGFPSTLEELPECWRETSTT